MDARWLQAVIVTAALALLGASHRTTNFLVEAPTAAAAQQYGEAAERFRKELALDWLGKELPRWTQPCPITVNVGPQLGAGGATKFVFDNGPSGQPEVFGWQMTVQGSHERILDSVLPHEITHTVFATHFRRPLPRWADEGACTTVEHASERTKHEQWLITFLRTNRGIPFDKMFAMKDYPHDIMPLYAQGHSAARFLIGQGGRRKFVEFLETGFRTANWPETVKQHYGYESLGELQSTWVKWVAAGSRDPIAPELLGSRARLQSSPNQAPITLAAAERDSTAVAQSAAGAKSWYARGTRTGGPRTDVTVVAAIRNDNAAEPATTFPAPRRETASVVSAAHPQAIEPARQRVLEWSRPASETSTPDRVEYDASLGSRRVWR